MLDQHLDTKRLLALYQGDTEDYAALEHLASCTRCRRAFDDSRWLNLLRHLPDLVKTGSHPDPDEIEAYRRSALSIPRVMEIERHLRSCAVCLAAYQRGWAEEQSLDYVSPSADLIGKARMAFRPGKQLWLGTVLVTGLEQGPGTVLLSDRRVASGPTLEAGEIPAFLRRDRGRGGHPSSARHRAQRLTEELNEGLNEELTASPIDRSVSARNMLRVFAGEFTLVIQPPSEQEPDRLGVGLEAADERPTGGIRIRVRNPSGEQTVDTTDATGRASLSVARGRSRIVIESNPPLAFSLSLLD